MKNIAVKPAAVVEKPADMQAVSSALEVNFKLATIANELVLKIEDRKKEIAGYEENLAVVRKQYSDQKGKLDGAFAALKG